MAFARITNSWRSTAYRDVYTSGINLLRDFLGQSTRRGEEDVLSAETRSELFKRRCNSRIRARRWDARFVQFEWRVGGEPVNFTPLSLSLFLFSLRPSSRPRRASKYTDRRINIPRTRIPTCAQHEQADEGRVECAALSRLVAASYANQAEKLACFQRVLIIQATQLSAMKLELAQR